MQLFTAAAGLLKCCFISTPTSKQWCDWGNDRQNEESAHARRLWQWRLQALFVSRLMVFVHLLRPCLSSVSSAFMRLCSDHKKWHRRESNIMVFFKVIMHWVGIFICDGKKGKSYSVSVCVCVCVCVTGGLLSCSMWLLCIISEVKDSILASFTLRYTGE